MFDLHGEIIEIIVENINFIISLSRRGVAVSLTGPVHGFGALTVQYFVNTYCMPGAHKSGIQFTIGKIANFPLKFIVTTITWVAYVATL